MERKDINFGVEKTDHKWYFHFDSSTGSINSMSVNKENSSLEIPTQLAENIQKGIDNMAFYKVVFKDGKYTHINTVEAQTTRSEEKINDDTGNIDVYKIGNNNTDTKIVFKHDKKILRISATDSMKTVIKNTFTEKKQNFHKFFICGKNDHSLLHKSLEIDLLDLIDSEIKIDMELQPNEYSIYCRKVFDYSNV